MLYPFIIYQLCDYIDVKHEIQALKFKRVILRQLIISRWIHEADAFLEMIIRIVTKNYNVHVLGPNSHMLYDRPSLKRHGNIPDILQELYAVNGVDE